MGARPGERRFPGRPQPCGLEVEAHSAYAPGDDLRHLDWNLFGRLDTLLMRRFTAEREVVVHLLVDASASMGVPAADGKWTATAELAPSRSPRSRSRAATPRGSRCCAAAARRGPRRCIAGARDSSRWPSCSTPPRRRSGSTSARRSASTPTGIAEGGAALVLSDFLLEPSRARAGRAALRRRGYAVVPAPGPRPRRARARARARERRAGGRRVRRATRAWRSTPRSSRATARCSRPTRTRCARSPCASAPRGRRS